MRNFARCNKTFNENVKILEQPRYIVVCIVALLLFMVFHVFDNGFIHLLTHSFMLDPASNERLLLLFDKISGCNNWL